MGLVKKLVAVFLGVAALVVAVHFMFSSFYRELVDTGAIWDVLNWFLAIGLVIALIASFHHKRTLDRRSATGSVTREYVEVNLIFYVTVVLVLWFFWNWSNDLVSVEPQGQTQRNIWVWINPLFVPIAAATALRLWRLPSHD